MSGTSQLQPSPWEKLLPRIRAAVSPRYDIVRLLGQGGMAGVFLAHDPKLDRRVAIKVISPGLMMDPEMVQRFEHEARTQAKFQHANIVPIFDVGEKDDLHYIAMPHVPGRTLGEVMADRDTPLPIPVIKTWLYQVGSALGYAHRRGVVHRDVKPGNILLDSDGKAMVTDFGIAKAVDQPGLTRTGMLIGTPSYMSPEQCETGEVSAASDQYSLGIVAYEMLTGRTPFTGNPLALLKAHLNDPVPPILESRPDCPPALAEAITRMLEKDADARWGTIDEAIAGGGAVPVPHGDPTQKTLAALSKRVAGFSFPSTAARLEVGQEASLTPVPVDSDGRAVPGRAVVFDSDDPEKVSVSPDGVISARDRGTARIRVRSGNTEESIVIDAVGEGGGAVGAAVRSSVKGKVVTTVGPLTWVQPPPRAPEPAPGGPGAATRLLGDFDSESDKTALATASAIEAATPGVGEPTPAGGAVAPPRGATDPAPIWRRPSTWVGATVLASVIAVAVSVSGTLGSADNGDRQAGQEAESSGDDITDAPGVLIATADSSAQADSIRLAATDTAAPVEEDPTPPPTQAAQTEVSQDRAVQQQSPATRQNQPVDPPARDPAPRQAPVETTEVAEEEDPTVLPPLAPATLAIVGELPEGSEVTISGDSMAPQVLSNRIIQLPPGRYRLVANAPGYKESSVELDLGEYAAETWDPELVGESGADLGGPGTPLEQIQIAIDGFVSAFRARRVERVVALLPSDTRDGFRAFMGMDVSRWDVTSGFDDIEDPQISGDQAQVDFSFTLRTRDVNSGDRTQQMSFQATLTQSGGRWQLMSVRPR